MNAPSLRILRRITLAFVPVIVLLLGVHASAQERIDINQASAQELESLPGIGPSKAKAIIDFRANEGRFVHPTDLKRVKGIGHVTFQKLCQKLEVEKQPGCDKDGVVSFPANDGGDGRVSLNAASAKELQGLPGIGKAKANAIVQKRAQGWFLKVEDLQGVDGFGPKNYAKIAPFVRTDTDLNGASPYELRALGLDADLVAKILKQRQRKPIRKKDAKRLLKGHFTRLEPILTF